MSCCDARRVTRFLRLKEAEKHHSTPCCCKWLVYYIFTDRKCIFKPKSEREGVTT